MLIAAITAFRHGLTEPGVSIRLVSVCRSGLSQSLQVAFCSLLRTSGDKGKRRRWFRRANSLAQRI